MMQGVANTGQIYKMTQQARQAWSMLIVRRSSLIIYNPTSPKLRKGKGKKEKEKGGKEKGKSTLATRTKQRIASNI